MKPEFSINQIRDFVSKGYPSVSARYTKSALQHYDAKVEEMPEFPNSFASWYETFAQIMKIITGDLYYQDDENKWPEALRFTQERLGSMGIYSLAKEWTDEFEKKYEGYEWDGEFFDFIERFVKEKYKEF